MKQDKHIVFNRASLVGNEITYIKESLANGHISGDGPFTKKCHEFFKKTYGFTHALLTTSCTDALEMTAILLRIKPGDEIIAPSYTFVSTINAFALFGAEIKFVDSRVDQPNIDETNIEALITKKTKAIVVVHYAGVACDMDAVMKIAKKYSIPVVEDCAQAIHSFYKGKPLGSFGAFATFSFHETKNITSGEGGMLIINDPAYAKRAEIIREKGTNRSAFFRGEIDKYGWVDVGSSFLPSDIIAAFLFAQLENLNIIQDKRKKIWERYEKGLQALVTEGKISIGKIPSYATNNYHMFYILCADVHVRSALITYLKEHGIHAVFHYLPLHASPYFLKNHPHVHLLNVERFSDTLLRLPFYIQLTENEQNFVIKTIQDFFSKYT